MERKQYIDRLKGLAIFFVVMGHIFLFSDHENDSINKFIGTFNMPLFMFLSGLVISAPPPRLKKVFNKWRRFLFPCLVVGIAFTLYKQENVTSFFTSPSKGGYWYLWVLAEFYIMLSLFRINRCNDIKGIVLDAFLFIIIYSLFYIIGKSLHINNNEDILCIGNCIAMWPFFMLGYFVRKYQLLIYLQKNSIIVTLSIIGFIITYSIIAFNGSSLGRYYKLAGLCMIVFLLYIFEKRENCNSLIENQLSIIGRHTLEIYIFHYFFIYNLNVGFIQSWALNTHNGYLLILFLIAISIVITYMSIVIGWLFHQEKWSQRLIYGG